MNEAPKAGPAEGDSRAERLVGASVALLAGLDSVSPGALVRVAQRLMMHQTTRGWPFRLAMQMGQPGLELIDPEALEIPDSIEADDAARMREALPKLATLLQRTADDVMELMPTLPAADGRLLLPETGPEPPEEMALVLADEAVATIANASDEALRADLALVLRGLTLILRKDSSPGVVTLLLQLLERVEEHEQELLSAFAPLLSDAQKERLGQLRPTRPLA
jgi:hypothetical protein